MKQAREAMVRQLLQQAGMSERVAEALRTVPRHLFLPEVDPREAYRDEPIVTKRDEHGQPISSSSQPAIMATMLDQLALEPGHRVLEIGAGTGYNAALLWSLTAPGGRVTTVDIDDDLVRQARDHLAAAGYPEVRVECVDGAAGFPGGAPYDRIIATVGVWDLAPAWAAQLAPDGRLVAPLDLRGVQVSAAFERLPGRWSSVSVVPAGFMRMRGTAAGPERLWQVAEGLTMFLPRPREVGDVALALSREPSAGVATGVRAGMGEVSVGLSLWLAVHDPRWFTLYGGSGLLPPAPVAHGGVRMTAGLAVQDGLAVLDDELAALGFGPRGPELAAALAGHVAAWEAAGRPATTGVRVEAQDLPCAASPPAGALVIDKRDTRLVVSFEAADRP
ncbi:methyltransferase domain-containing protein [Nonomuraea sp. NPDC050790]|uniref:methyltransferase domain-containing protein n=1 Tax=Nonomuraea sp. NPDC050790 TaxID=3364371 RepID=UPI0037B9433D